MSTLMQIDVDGERHAPLRVMQLHPVKDFILHADFLRLGKGAKIAVEIPVNFLNEDTCPGLKQGGVLNVVRYQVELTVQLLKFQIYELDLAEANIGDSLHISDVKLPEGVVPTIADRDFTIATIAAPAGLDDTDDEVEEGIEGEEGDEGDSNEEGEE